MVNRFMIAAAVAAATLGCVAKVSPHLFLRIPNVGFIFHAMATGSPPPPYFSPAAWTEEELPTWLRDGDLIVATGTKSGTHWMLYCTHQIRTKGADDADELFGDVGYGTWWPDLVQTPGRVWAQDKDLWNTTILPDGTPLKDHWDNPRYPFRIFKSHYGPKESGGVLPIRFLGENFPNAKILAMSRNGLDVVRSLVPFFNDHTEEFRAMWGGFPPPSAGNFEVDREARMNEMLPGGPLGGLYFGYVKQWWQMRKEKNVMLLHYKDVLEDLSGTVAKLAKFLGVKLSKKESGIITERCGMAHMKSISDRFSSKMALNQNSPNMPIMKSGGKILRTGGLGEGTKLFSDEQKARWAAAEEAEFGDDPDLLKWARAGGDIN